MANIVIHQSCQHHTVNTNDSPSESVEILKENVLDFRENISNQTQCLTHKISLAIDNKSTFGTLQASKTLSCLLVLVALFQFVYKSE